LLWLYRCESGNEIASYSELASALRPPSSDIPQENCATVQDCWLQLSRNLSPEALAAGLHEQYPMQAAGFAARTARASDHFTAHDGMTGPFPEDEARFSASALQSLASCPYRVFLRSLLKLRPPRSMREDARQWLDAAEYGTLVHNVLRQFMQDVRDEDLPRDQWSTRMQRTLETAIEDKVERIPPPNRAARVRIERTLRDDCALFLRDEIAATDTTPLAFEVAFPDEAPLPAPLTPLKEALHLPVPGGGVLLHGQIDRIDSLADNGFHIIDYKTGKARSDANHPIAGGKQLQPSLYVEALRAMCENKDVHIAFSYRHISAREQGRIVTVETPIEQALRCIGLLLELRRNGCFPHTIDKEECSFCDYAQLCGDADQTTAQMKRKLERLENTELNAWRTVRDEF
jgi:ATP-dependent helicase/DNAse subunit B